MQDFETLTQQFEARVQRVVKDAVAQFGPDYQAGRAIEECAELIVAVKQHNDGYSSINVRLEETADVFIVLEALMVIIEDGRARVEEMEHALALALKPRGLVENCAHLIVTLQHHARGRATEDDVVEAIARLHSTIRPRRKDARVVHFMGNKITRLEERVRRAREANCNWEVPD
jgi:hypothetical protein